MSWITVARIVIPSRLPPSTSVTSRPLNRKKLPWSVPSVPTLTRLPPRSAMRPADGMKLTCASVSSCRTMVIWTSSSFRHPPGSFAERRKVTTPPRLRLPLTDPPIAGPGGGDPGAAEAEAMATSVAKARAEQSAIGLASRPNERRTTGEPGTA